MAARSHPLITDCVAVGIGDERLGERVALVVAVSGSLSADDVIDHVKSRQAGYKAPRKVVFVDEVYRRARPITNGHDTSQNRARRARVESLLGRWTLQSKLARAVKSES